MIFLSHLINQLLDKGSSKLMVTGQKRVMVKSGVPRGSVLRLLLFLIYINDLFENLICISKTYAGVSKLFYCVMNRGDINGDSLQSNIGNLVDWCSILCIQLNFKNCCGMHYGAKNPKLEYSIKKNDPHIITAM